MARFHGRCPHGERLTSLGPHSHSKTTTFVAALRLTGIAAPFVLDGPINRDAFETCVVALVPELAPGDIVVMDNLVSHKGLAVRAAIQATGGLPFRPPHYSDFNPIEMSLLDAQAGLRKAAEHNAEELWAMNGRLVDTVTPNEAANVFAFAGYDPD